MSIRLEQEVKAIERRVSELEKQIAEALALLRAMTRASTPKGRAA